jgi:hypothetical protein
LGEIRIKELSVQNPQRTILLQERTGGFLGDHLIFFRKNENCEYISGLGI